MNLFSMHLSYITSSPYFDQMVQYVAPLYEYLGINHFWYYQINRSGDYAYFGTHLKWSEFCFNEGLTNHFSCLRHPDTLQGGIQLMKACEDIHYQKVLDIAWSKFKINFNINLIEKNAEGIEAFGFATCFKDLKAEERLLNELPLLSAITKKCKLKYKKLFQLLDENRINLIDQFGSAFYERSKEVALSCNRDKILLKMGIQEAFSLTPREIDVLRYAMYGYPAGFIGEKLQITKKTAENYIATIKCKLNCSSKGELIEKAREIISFLT